MWEFTSLAKWIGGLSIRDRPSLLINRYFFPSDLSIKIVSSLPLEKLVILTFS